MTGCSYESDLGKRRGALGTVQWNLDFGVPLG